MNETEQESCSTKCQFRQVAALLNLKIELLADMMPGISLEEIREEIAELEIERVKITTDPEYREAQYNLNACLFSLTR